MTRKLTVLFAGALGALAACGSDSKSSKSTPEAGAGGAGGSPARDAAAADRPMSTPDAPVDAPSTPRDGAPAADAAPTQSSRPDAAAAPALTAAPAGTSYVYVGSDRGIDILYMDAAGALTPKSWFGYDPSIGFMNASFMVINDRYVYVVSDAPPSGQTASRLFAFAIDPMTGALSLLNHVSTEGPAAVHVWVDRQRRRAFVANFNDDANMPMRPDINTIAVFSLMTDGKIGSMIGPLTKAGKNPHAIYFPEPLGRLAYVPALQDGTIGQFRVTDKGFEDPDLNFSLVQPAPDGGAPDAAPTVAPDAGATDARPPAQCTRSSRNLGGRNPGPRHMAFSNDGRRAYLLSEFAANVHVFEVGAADGKLQGSGLNPAQEVSVVPPDVRPNVDFRTLGLRAAEIYLHPTGRWLYTSLRLDRCDYNSAGNPAWQADREDGYVTRFVVGNDGRLSSPQYVKVNKEPRYFTLTPDGNFLLVVGQKATTDNVLVYKVDTTASGAGKLVEPPVGKATTGRTWDGREPNQGRSIVIFKRP